MLFTKHTEEQTASRGFTIAELGAGLGVFALAASLMVPMAMTTGTTLADGGTIQTVSSTDKDGRKIITTPDTEAVEVIVLDANGNQVKKQTVTDPNASSTVISQLDPNGTYTFEVSKINKAGASAKATTKLDYKQTGSVTENYTVTVPIQIPRSATYNSVAEQVDDTSRPIYVTVEDRSKKHYRNVTETYQVRVNKSETRYRTEAYTYVHLHYDTARVARTRSYNHVHHHSRSWNHVHTGNSCTGFGRNRRCRTTYTNHRHTDRWTSNHTHRETYYENVTQVFRHTHNATRPVPYTHNYTVMENRTRTVSVFSHYGTKQEFRGYNKKTQHRLCIPGQGCSVSSSPASRTLTWTEPGTRQEARSRQLPVYGHVAQKMVKAPSNFVVFKASDVSTTSFLSGGKIAAVGSGVSNATTGQTKTFLRHSGRTFTFQGEKYIQVHKWALQG